MKRIIIALIAVVAVIIVGAIAMSFAARGALKAIEHQRHDIVGLAVDVDDYSINWLTATITLEGINIYPAGKEEKRFLLAKADKLKVALTPRDLLKKAIHARKITLVKPTINLVETSHNKFNWDALDLGGKDDVEKKDKEKDGDWKVWIDNVKIKDGEINYQSRRRGHRVRLTKAKMTIKNIDSESDADELPTRLNLKAKIDDDKGSLDVRGRLNLFAEGINFKLRSVINDAPITYFRSFYAGQTPFSIRSGRLSLSSKATSKESELVAYNHATIRDLKVGGMKGKLINTFILSHHGPVEVDVTVKGNLEKRNLGVGSRLSKGIGLGIVKQASKVPGMSTAGEKIKGVGRSIGDGVKGIFKR